MENREKIEATDHDMLVPDCSPHPPTSLDLSGEVGWPCYFLLWLKDYILETYMLLAEVGVGQQALVTLVKTTRFCSGRGVKRGRKQNDEYFGIELGRERNRRKMEKTFKGKRLGDRKKERERRKSKKESKNVGIDKRKENVQVNRKERTIDTQRETNKKWAASCGALGRAVASYTRQPRFESSHLLNLK